MVQANLHYVISTTTLFVGSRAGLSQLRDGLAAGLENATDGTATVRGLPSSATGFVDEMLKPYGCWCYFGGGELATHYGRGEPVDEWDGYCKTLEEGYTCSGIDAARVGGSCEAWSTDYLIDDRIALRAALMIPDPQDAIEHLQDKCASAGSMCAVNSCIIEQTYIYNALRYLLPFLTPSSTLNEVAQAATDPVFYSDNGFNQATDCPVKQGGRVSEKSCCGEYPTRFPYKNLEGERRCCQAMDGTGVTYNNNRHICCGDGSVKAIGVSC